MRILFLLFVVAAVALPAAPDLDKLLARWKPVPMPFDAAGLTARERQMIDKLVEGCRYLEDVFWRQSDPEGLKLLKSLEGSANPRDEKLRRLLMINGSRFDLVAGNKPFIGTEPYSPDTGLYPKGLTRAEIEQYVKAHPEKRAEVYSPYTVVRRRGSELVGIPYRVDYKQFLEPAAKALREAAALSDDPRFAHFLRLRADALLTDDYYASDLAWLDMQDSKFDVIFAPYETYLDDILGVKTSYGAAVLIRNEEESRKLAAFKKYVPAIQKALPLAPADLPSNEGHATPMEVADSPFRAGDLRHGYQAVADNLPNDPRIHAAKGSKKIFFKNFLDARVEYIILPLASRLMTSQQAALVSREGYFEDTLLHEISHGLGPAWAHINGKQVDIREAIGPLYSGLEEAKADTVGLFGMKWLVDHGALPAAELNRGYASHVADLFRMLRFGTAEAHAVSEIMQFNYYVEQKAIVWDAAARRYTVDFARMPQAVARLTKELLEIEATGDAARAQNWFARYRSVPPELDGALASAANLPVDIDPVFSFPDQPR